jgi:hypothetical protein
MVVCACQQQDYKDFDAITYYRVIVGRPLLAGDCLLAQPLGGPLTRKLPPKPAESEAIFDPKLTPTKKHEQNGWRDYF